MLLSAKKIKSDNNTRIIWLHGWGQDHKSFLSMACLFNDCENIMIDMAGFGAAKKPKEAWGTNDYALDLAQYLKKDVADDDILDALIVLWSTKRIASGEAKFLPTHPRKPNMRIGY